MIMDNRDDEDTDDAETDTDADDEFIPGCYELDISPNPVSKFKFVWLLIRAMLPIMALTAISQSSANIPPSSAIKNQSKCDGPVN